MRMRMPLRTSWLLLALLCACAGSAIERDRAYEAGVAAVEKLDVTVHRERPVSVDVTVSGELPDACTLIHRAQQERQPSGVAVTLTTRRESGANCPPEPRAFQRTLTLDTHGLPPGLYFVSVNGVSSTFEIQADSVSPDPFERYRTW